MYLKRLDFHGLGVCGDVGWEGSIVANLLVQHGAAQQRLGRVSHLHGGSRHRARKKKKAVLRVALKRDKDMWRHQIDRESRDRIRDNER